MIQPGRASTPAPGPPILVVDDEPDLRVLVRTVLERAGYRTLEAASGELALVAFEREPLALVLLDLQLPGIQGFDVLAQIRERDRELPVVVLSAHTSAEAELAVMAAGGNGYLAKPFRASRLLEVAAALLRPSVPQPGSRSDRKRPAVAAVDDARHTVRELCRAGQHQG